MLLVIRGRIRDGFEYGEMNRQIIGELFLFIYLLTIRMI